MLLRLAWVSNETSLAAHFFGKVADVYSCLTQANIISIFAKGMSSRSKIIIHSTLLLHSLPTNEKQDF